MRRDFDPCLMEYGNKQVSGLKITCGRCSISEKIRRNTFGGPVDVGVASHQAERRFEKAGWRVGKRACDDRCPQCANRPIEIVAHQPSVAVLQQAEAAAPESLSLTTIVDRLDRIETALALIVEHFIKTASQIQLKD